MPTMPYHRHDGAQKSDSIEILAAVHRVVPNGVDVNSWDHETGRMATSSAYTGLAQGERADRIARSMRSTRYAVDHLGNDKADLDRLANVQANHYRFRAHCLRGRGNVRTMSPGTTQVIDDYPPFAGRSVEARTYTTVRVTHVVENNLPAELHEAAQALAGDTGLPEWAKVPAGAEGRPRDKSRSGYTNQFYCVPRDTPIVPSYVEERDVPRRRRLRGLVMSVTDQSETWGDGLNRVLVQLLGGEPGANTTAWVRASVSWGGKDHGHVGVLRAGTEVEIEWLGPDRIAIVDVYYNQATPPPLFDHLEGWPENDAYSGIISRELNGTRQQQLRFDDSQRDISVQLGTDEAATQLNIGSLSTPLERGRNKPRGRGYEVRTDALGVHRAGQGMLVTTEMRENATGHLSDMGETVDRLANAQAQHENLSHAAHQAQAQTSGDQDAVAKALKVQLQDIKGSGGRPDLNQFPEFQQPHLVLASPAGMATSTRGSTHVASTEDNALTSGGHTSVSAGKSFLLSAKEAVRLFACNAGMKLVAATCDIEISALKNCIKIFAQLEITQVANRIMITGKDEVVLNGGGSSICLNASGITYSTGGACRQQAASHSFSGPASAPLPALKALDVALKETPAEDQIMYAVRHVPGESLLQYAKQPYTLLKNGAEVKKGVFDEYGRLTVDKAEKGARYQVRLHNGTVYDVPTAQERMASDPTDLQYDEHQLSNQGYRADGRTAAERLAQRDRGTTDNADADGEPDAGGGSTGSTGAAASNDSDSSTLA
jgi:type VI secretion system secreted protein VgrG